MCRYVTYFNPSDSSSTIRTGWTSWTLHKVNKIKIKLNQTSNYFWIIMCSVLFKPDLLSVLDLLELRQVLGFLMFPVLLRDPQVLDLLYHPDTNQLSRFHKNTLNNEMKPNVRVLTLTPMMPSAPDTPSAPGKP